MFPLLGISMCLNQKSMCLSCAKSTISWCELKRKKLCPGMFFAYFRREHLVWSRPGWSSSEKPQPSKTTWWFIPLSKWVMTPVISGLTLLIPFTTRVITHLRFVGWATKYRRLWLKIKLTWVYVQQFPGPQHFASSIAQFPTRLYIWNYSTYSYPGWWYISSISVDSRRYLGLPFT